LCPDVILTLSRTPISPSELAEVPVVAAAIAAAIRTSMAQSTQPDDGGRASAVRSDLQPPAVATAPSALSSFAVSEVSAASLDGGYSASPPAPCYEGDGEADRGASISEEGGADRWWYSLEGTQVGASK